MGAARNSGQPFLRQEKSKADFIQKDELVLG